MNKLIALIILILSPLVNAALVVDDATDYYATRPISDLSFINNDTRFYVVHFKTDATDLTDQTIFTEGKTSAAQRGLRLRIAYTSGQPQMQAMIRASSGVDNIISLGTTIANTEYTVVLGVESGTLSAWVNSTTELTLAVSPSTETIETIDIGRYWNSGAGSSYATMQISYFYVYDSKPSATTISQLMAGTQPRRAGAPIAGWDLVANANQTIGGSTAFTLGNGAAFDAYDPIPALNVGITSITGASADTIRSGEAFQVVATNLTAQTSASLVTILGGIDGDDVPCIISEWDHATGTITAIAPTTNLKFTGTKTVEVEDAINGSDQRASITYLPATGYNFAVLGAGPTYPAAGLLAYTTNEKPGDELVYQIAASPNGTVAVTSDWVATITSATDINHTFNYYVLDATDGIRSTPQIVTYLTGSGTKKLKIGTSTKPIKAGGAVLTDVYDTVTIYSDNPITFPSITNAVPLVELENVQITAGIGVATQANIHAGSPSPLTTLTDGTYWVISTRVNPSTGKTAINVDQWQVVTE